MDKIKIQKLHIYAHHGVYDFEKENGQNFYVSAELVTDSYIAGHTDDLDNTVNYASVCDVINDVFTKEKYDLIERAAEAVAEAVLLSFSPVKSVKVEVSKPEAPIDMEFDSVSVEIERKWHKVYISIGSNMGDKQAYIDKAIAALDADSYIRLGRVSSMIITAPYGGVEQDDFINGAVEIDTLYSPEALLDKLHEIEQDCERVRILRWGPRTLDLDIIFYDDVIMHTKKLTIPHIDMVNRQFVLEPLCEIAPFYEHPVEHKSVKALYDQLNAASFAAVNSET